MADATPTSTTTTAATATVATPPVAAAATAATAAVGTGAGTKSNKLRLKSRSAAASGGSGGSAVSAGAAAAASAAVLAEPPWITEADPKLAVAIAASGLPAHYNFEIPKTVWRVKRSGARTVALQFPEGLLMYACIISDLLEQFAGGVQTLIMGDVTYGACCVDDYTARALGCEFLVHYGHSCLVPIDTTQITTLYVFVDIAIDVDHLIRTVKHNFTDANARLVLAGTIQFATAMQIARNALTPCYKELFIPQAKPLSRTCDVRCCFRSLYSQY